MTGIDEAAAKKIVDILHKKYLQMIKMHDLTRQMKEPVDRNDNVSVQMFMNMRQDVMLAVDDLDGQVSQIVSTLPEDVQERMARMLSPNWEDLHIEETCEQLIVQEYDKIQKQLQKTIALDMELNKRITGNDSIYDKK